MGRKLNRPKSPIFLYLKDNVYENNPQTIPEPKRSITANIRTIPVEECVRVIDTFARRVQVCLQRRGGTPGAHFGKSVQQRLFYPRWTSCARTLINVL